jgi:hypothetical protein
MLQGIFIPSYAEFLQANVSENLKYYIDPSHDWKLAAGDNVKELDFEQPDLSGMMEFAESKKAVDDFYAAKILFEAYRGVLTPLLAAQSHFWQYLSHVVLYPYMRKRWPEIDNPDCRASYISEHWFYEQGLIRNWLEGMYWSVHNTVIENEDGTLDYKYTRLLFSIQKLRDRGIAAATYIFSNPILVRGILDFYFDELDKAEKGEETVFDKYFEYRTDKCIQLINKLGGVVELSMLTSEDIYNFLEENRDVIKSVGDRKKEKKLRDEAQAAFENASPDSPVQGTSKKSKHKKSKHRRR